MLSFNTGNVLTANILVHNNIVKRLTISVCPLGTKPDNVELICARSSLTWIPRSITILKFSVKSSAICQRSLSVNFLIGMAKTCN